MRVKFNVPKSGEFHGMGFVAEGYVGWERSAFNEVDPDMDGERWAGSQNLQWMLFSKRE